ncbi:hypothetical protein SANA_22930 [Gottschalkiaceae bacterium SANA]|nr:hypothetical protein SANA_22930 [Gottschalkiaceae bacterium SANA]
MRVKMKKTSASSAGVFLNNREYDLETEFAESLVLVGAAVSLEPEESEPQEDHEEDPDSLLNHVGGGYFELPNGERIKGKDKAEKALVDYLQEQEEKASGNGADQEGDE